MDAKVEIVTDNRHRPEDGYGSSMHDHQSQENEEAVYPHTVINGGKVM